MLLIYCIGVSAVQLVSYSGQPNALISVKLIYFTIKLKSPKQCSSLIWACQISFSQVVKEICEMSVLFCINLMFVYIPD